MRGQASTYTDLPEYLASAAVCAHTPRHRDTLRMPESVRNDSAWPSGSIRGIRIIRHCVPLQLQCLSRNPGGRSPHDARTAVVRWSLTRWDDKSESHRLGERQPSEGALLRSLAV